MFPVEWQRLRLVVFDIDGTLYDASCMRLRMMAALAIHCLERPGQIRVLRQIAAFRRSRESLAEAGEAGIAALQYAKPAARLGVTPEALEETVRIWMLERPLPYLRKCRFSSVGRFFERLRTAGIRIAVLSDYPTRAKLESLELEADFLVAAVDPEVDRLKPDPAGLRQALSLAGVPPEDSLMIGDREDRDGECARRAGVPYLLKASRSRPAQRRFARYAELERAMAGGAARGAALE